MSKNNVVSKDWRFYAAITAGIAFAGTSAFLISSKNSIAPWKNVTKKNFETKSPTAEMYASITDTAISTMSAQERLTASNVLKNRGNEAFSKQNYLGAIEFYTHAIRFKPDPIFYSNRAACYANMKGHNDQVLKDCNEALKIKPTYTKAINRRAQALERNGDRTNALFDYISVCILEGFKNNNAARSMERLLKRNSESKAMEMIKTMKPNRLPSPTFVGAYLDSFRQDAKNDAFPSVTTTLECGDTYYAKAKRYMTAKQYIEAAYACDKAVQLGCTPEYQPLALHLKGTFKFLQGQTDQALLCFQQSMTLDSTYIQNYIKSSSVYMDQGDLKSALYMFEKAIALNPLDPDIYYHRGQVYYISGQFDQALSNYKKSIELNPTFVYSHIQLAVVYYRMGNSVDSLQVFQAAVQAFPLSSAVFNYYGEMMVDHDRHVEAIELFNKAMTLDPNHPLPYINKAMVLYQKMNGVEEAIHLCESALEVDPACDAAVASLAQILLEQDRRTEALLYYQKAVDLARTETELQLALSYVEATQMQIRFAQTYPDAASKLSTLNLI